MKKSKGIAHANSLRKPSGQLSSEAAYILKKVTAGRASAAARAHTGFQSFIAVGRLNNNQSHLRRLGIELRDAGLLCEHTVWLINAKRSDVRERMLLP